MKKVLFILSTVVVALCSCNKINSDNINPATFDDQTVVLTKTPIYFQNGVLTKVVSEVTTDNLKSFYAAAAKGDGSYVWSNYGFSIPEGKNYFAGTSGDKFWPKSKTEIASFYASNISMTCPATGAPTVSATNDKDIVCAVEAIGESKYGKETTSLTFNHIFARLCGKVSVKAKDGYTASDIKLTFTPKVSGTYNLSTGNGKTDGTGWSSISAAASATVFFNDADITTAGGSIESSESYNIYLVPGEYTVTASYKLTKGDYTVEKTDVTNTINLVAGKKNIFRGILGLGDDEDAKAIHFEVTVTEWGSNDIGDVDFK